MKIDVPSAKENTLSEQVGMELRQTMDELEHNGQVKAVVLMSGKTNSFVAGADIGMLSKCKSASEAEKISRDAQIQFERLQNSKKPIVAAIMGESVWGVVARLD